MLTSAAARASGRSPGVSRSTTADVGPAVPPPGSREKWVSATTMARQPRAATPTSVLDLMTGGLARYRPPRGRHAQHDAQLVEVVPVAVLLGRWELWSWRISRRYLAQRSASGSCSRLKRRGGVSAGTLAMLVRR